MEDASDDEVSGEELRRWLDAGDGDARPATDEGAPRRQLPRRWLLTALAAPWVLLAIALTGIGDGPPPDPGPTGTTQPHATPSDAVPPDTSDLTPSDAEAPGAPGPPAAVAPTAVGMVRDAVTTASGGVTTALDSATPERPSSLGGHTWLVRVHAVVLRGDRRRWRSARHEVWAAPVGRRDGMVAGLDRPWRVAATDLGHRPPDWREALGDLAAVRRALRAAGLPAGPQLRLQRDPALPAVVRAVTGSSSVWLRAGEHPLVLGTEAS